MVTGQMYIGTKGNILLNGYRYNSWYAGGGRGIRTPEDLAALTDFKSQWLE